ncbi:type II toxin-antitoxin system HicB family antitoxin [Carboxydochorda subterranea]|uniref:Type II toxin-antitoxin system HicB family antitoxin n=1 Tax=Carboxydichorda subterranea TaxID=3109565 RepID=A0ABZ1C1E0_9FIRM|nr:type II toxin-antitoxin system HicB family antitoxin [Limnochorda sp. L945t]WRP18693.1 type II toxin-antitoxin system HicB family antitoxin [Limnochorda sp. L945t]
MVRRFKVVLEWDEDGPGYVVRVPALPGCFTQGSTRQQALERVREAIEGHLQALAANGEPIPEGDVDVSIEEVEVPV